MTPPDSVSPRMSRTRTAATVIAVTVLLFVVVEGLASVIFSVNALMFGRVEFMAEERSHTEYDPMLGWVNRKNLYVPNMYGSGVYFRSNAQRLRANRNYTPEVPAGKTRVICSGDSFAMGHSVSNDEAWCARLEAMDSRIESVNMGEAAYGLDQAFLWYRRDGGSLRHDALLFSMITSDFARVQADNYGGYPKPYLRVRQGALVVENTPVPRRVGALVRTARMRAAANDLRIVQIGLALVRRLGLGGEPKPERQALTVDQARAVIAKIFEDLKQLNSERGSTLVLVYLPKSGDSDNRTADQWRTFVAEQAKRLNIPFVDLVVDFRKLPISEGEELFVRPYFPSHYNPRGNEWVAELLHERLLQIPSLRDRIARSAAIRAQ